MRTRLAPSPTGALHLGNARTFLVTWLLARQRGWAVTLRVEDLDGPRVKAGAAAAAVDDLTWLGLDWDDGPLLQSTRAAAHAAAVRQLLDAGHAYPCACTRREVDAAASAPHAEDGASVYPGTCRGRFATVEDAIKAAGRPPAIRFRVEPGPVSWDDAVAGPQRYADVAAQLGDFVVAKADGTPAYQLAVVVDDAAAGVTHVVRGDDLLDSTPRQILLYRALGLGEPPTNATEPSEPSGSAAGSAPTAHLGSLAGRPAAEPLGSDGRERGGPRPPTYAHLPLIVGPDGRRLAKRHGDSRLSFYRARGVTAGRVRQLLARWCGLDVAPDATPADLLARFDLGRLPRHPIVYAAGDEADLLRV